MNVLSAVLLVVWAVIGIAAVIRELALKLFCRKDDGIIMFVTPMSGRCENAELLLRNAAARVRWMSRGRHDGVICLDCGMDGETRKVCESICKEYGFADLMTKKEFIERMEL